MLDNRNRVSRTFIPIHSSDRGVGPFWPNALSERRVDASLRGNGMASRGEKLRDTRSIESVFGQPKGCPQAGTSGANNNRIVLVILR